MKLGFSLSVAGAWATPENQVRIAQSAEALGYESLWVFQRLLRALEPQNDYPPMPGQPWPQVFERVVDPIVTLAYVAGATSTIRLGTSILIMPYYSPIILAKQLATLDLVSSGRLHVGLGVGWSKDEFEAVGVPYGQRGKRGDEFIECLKAIWTQEEVEFRGQFYTVPRSKIGPKPVQKPHPPLTVGGYGAAAVKRAAALADGFMGGNVPLHEVAPLVKDLKLAVEAAGRDFDTLQVVSRGTYRLHEAPQGENRRPLWGDLEEIKQDIKRYADAGLTELFLEANFDPDVSLPQTLEVMAALAPGNIDL